jgi:hypothetical protein
MADCHPDRPHQARGLCNLCYQREYEKTRSKTRRRKDPDGYAPNYRKPPLRVGRVPDCHPDRKHMGLGMCGPCYRTARSKGGPGSATCHPDRPMLARGLCHPCYSKLRYWDDPEKYRAVARAAGAATRQRLRDELVAAYGGRCACANCPETDPAFLTLDHSGGDGKAHRIEMGSHTYGDLRRRGWPQEGYRLLCWNCNAMTRFGRTCPHEGVPDE